MGEHLPVPGAGVPEHSCGKEAEQPARTLALGTALTSHLGFQTLTDMMRMKAGVLGDYLCESHV